MLPARMNRPISRSEGAPVNRLSTVFDRLFDDFLSPGSSMLSASLPISMWEDENHLHIEMDAPGVTDKDIDITVEGDALVIRGERKCESREGGYDNRCYGRFEQRIGLTAPVDVENVDAKLTNGVLSVTFPKTEESKPRKIALKSS